MIKKISLFDTFKNAMLNDPKASRKEAFAHFLDSVRANPAMVDALAEDYFYRMAAQWEPQKTGKNSYSLVGTPATNRRAEVSAERRADNAARMATATADMKSRLRNIILLDIMLPSGKKLRHSTGAECAKAGGFYTEVSRHLKPTEVVDKNLSEADLRNIQSRYEGSKRRPAAAEHELRA